MNNRILRIIICIVLMVSLVMCEAAVGFAAETAANNEQTITDTVEGEVDTEQGEEPSEPEEPEAKEVIYVSHKFKSGSKYAYTGYKIKPSLYSLTVKIDGTKKTITEFTDVSITYGTNKYIGNGYVYANVEGTQIKIPFEIVPGKVKSVKARPLSYKSIKLSWSKVTGASGYLVYRYSNKSGKYEPIKRIESGSTLNYTSTGLTVGKTYYYKVRAYKLKDDKRIYGELSSYASQRVKPAATSISSIKPVDHSTLKISWKKVTGASGYLIYRYSGTSGKYEPIKRIRSGSTLNYKNTGLKIGKTYYYKVRAYTYKNGKRIYSDYSSYASQRVKPATSSISSIRRVDHRTLKISWEKVSGATGYSVYRSTSPKGEFKWVATVNGEKALTYVDKNRTCGRSYYYRIRTIKSVSGKKYYSDLSSYKYFWTRPIPTKFNEQTVDWYSATDLSWNKSNGATGYEIYRSTNSASGYKMVKRITNGNTVKWRNSSLSGSTKYYFKVRPYVYLDGNRIYGAYSKVYAKQLVPKNLENLINKYEGKPYRFGGNTPSGWDCSGFVQWATKYLFGKEIPRTAGDQARGGKYVNKSNMSTWKPGDVLVYKRNGGGVSHVGMYIGNGKMMHALNSRYDTIIQDVSYYEKWDGGNYLAGVRRYN